MNFQVAVVALAIALFTHAAAYLVGSQRGAAAERVVWVHREQIRAEVVAAVEAETAAKMEKLHEEIKTLSAQPEHIRTVTERIFVESDKKCESLPPDWKKLWNAN